MLRKWAEEPGERLEDLALFVQGFGNVASCAPRFLARAGATLKAVEDVTGAIPKSGGIDPEAFYEHVARNRGVAGYESADLVDHRKFLGVEADVFIPAALENQITGETAPLLNVSLVVEAANGPTDADGEKTVVLRGIGLPPHILCNAGGVIVS